MVLQANHAAVQACRIGVSNSSQEAVEAFADLCHRYQDVEVRWTPSHNGIAGNEKADTLARLALSKPVSNLGARSTNLVTDFGG